VGQDLIEAFRRGGAAPKCGKDSANGRIRVVYEMVTEEECEYQKTSGSKAHEPKLNCHNACLLSMVLTDCFENVGIRACFAGLSVMAFQDSEIADGVGSLLGSTRQLGLLLLDSFLQASRQERKHKSYNRKCSKQDQRQFPVVVESYSKRSN